MKALGQTESLQLPHPWFEFGNRETKVIREQAGVGLRHVLNDLQVRLRPRTALAVLVELLELGNYLV